MIDLDICTVQYSSDRPCHAILPLNREKRLHWTRVYPRRQLPQKKKNTKIPYFLPIDHAGLNIEPLFHVSISRHPSDTLLMMGIDDKCSDVNNNNSRRYGPLSQVFFIHATHGSVIVGNEIARIRYNCTPAEPDENAKQSDPLADNHAAVMIVATTTSIPK